MGKAIIKSDLGGGKYTIELPMQQGYTNNILARLNKRILYLQTQITLAESDLDDLALALIAVEGQTALDITAAKSAIETYEANIKTYTSQLTALNKELQVLEDTFPKDTQAIADKKVEIKAKEKQIADEQKKIDDKNKEIAVLQAKVDKAKLDIEVKNQQIAFMKAELLSTEKRYAYIIMWGVIPNYDVTAWCCDLTEGLTGTVMILEINTDVDSGVNIFPQYDGAAPGYSLDTMGETLPFVSLPLADALRNFCAMPAIQKWAPSFRYGEMTAIDYGANTCTVSLANIRSRIQSLAIDQTNSLTNVPIEYMSCDAGAFNVDDEVVIQFTDHDWSKPKVIGFKEFPKPCGWEEPWDGPLFNTRYPWVYRYGFYEGSGTEATMEVISGEIVVSYPDTSDTGPRAIEQYHNLQFYNPDHSQITGNVSKCKFDAEPLLGCLETRGTDSDDYHLIVVGWNVPKTYLLTYIFYIRKTAGYDGVGCYDYPEYANTYTEFPEIPHIFSTDLWWWPEVGTVEVRGYYRQIIKNKQEFMELPEEMLEVIGIGLEMKTSWQGGWTANTPRQISGGSMSCNLISLI